MARAPRQRRREVRLLRQERRLGAVSCSCVLQISVIGRSMKSGSHDVQHLRRLDGQLPAFDQPLQERCAELSRRDRRRFHPSRHRSRAIEAGVSWCRRPSDSTLASRSSGARKNTQGMTAISARPAPEYRPGAQGRRCTLHIPRSVVGVSDDARQMRKT